MVVNSCNDPKLCPGGNCYGCKAGKPFDDPRCTPNCYPLVAYHESVTNATFLMIISILLVIMFLLIAYYWFIR